MPKEKSDSFEKWTQQELKKVFQLVFVPQQAEHQHWLDLVLPANLELTETERQLLQEAQIEAIKYVDTWTEQELVIHYISLMIRFAKLHQANYQAFANRYLRAKVDAHILNGWVDFMVASGEFEPESPYFCFHEYKRTRSGHETDPVGQLLATMLAAQATNQDQQPIYGVYVIGRLWYFVTLIRREYSISLPFDSTKADLWDIMRLLKGLNILIAERLKSTLPINANA